MLATFLYEVPTSELIFVSEQEVGRARAASAAGRAGRAPSSAPTPTPVAPVPQANVSLSPTQAQTSKPLPSTPTLGKSPSSGSLSRATTATSSGSQRSLGSTVGKAAAQATTAPAATSRATTGGMRDKQEGKKKTGIDALLEWCQQTCTGYPEVKITNFTTSWKDGLAFCALMHKYHADSIDYQDMLTKTPHERLVAAFEAGALHVRLPHSPCIDPLAHN